jgi:hypothetical protein
MDEALSIDIPRNSKVKHDRHNSVVELFEALETPTFRVVVNQPV